MIPPIPLRWLIGGGTAIALLVGAGMWFNMRLDAEYKRGKADCQAAALASAIEAGKRTEAAATDLAATANAIRAIETREINNVEIRYRDRPERACFDADSLRAVSEARARVLADATGASGDTVPDGATAGNRD